MLVIQMELFEGVTLDRWLAEPALWCQGLRGPDSLQGAMDLFRKMITGLAELHREGIIHRDVKPENILMSMTDGAVKIIDFGLARRGSMPHGTNGPKCPPAGCG